MATESPRTSFPILLVLVPNNADDGIQECSVYLQACGSGTRAGLRIRDVRGLVVLDRSRIASLTAAIFYSFSPFAISQWLSGHLDVQTSIALGPIVIWCITRVLDTGSKRAAIGLGLCVSALLLLTTGQAAYWIPVALIVIIVKFVTAPRDAGSMLWRALPGAALSIAVFMVASSVRLIPWIFGARAAFVGGQIWLSRRSLHTRVIAYLLMKI